MDRLRGDCDQSQTDRYFQQQLEIAHPLLRQWDGSDAGVSEVDNELDELTLNLEHPSRSGSLAIVCRTPLHFAGPVSWSDSYIRIDRDSDEFRVVDMRANVVLRACVVEVFEVKETNLDSTVHNVRPSNSGSTTGHTASFCELGDVKLFDSNTIALFHSLRRQYSRAAAGLIDDLSVELASEAQKRPINVAKVDLLTRILRDCFRPIDTNMPECHPWDQAYTIFGRFLWRDNAVLHHSVREITGWPDDKINECKLAYRESVRIIRDEWQLAFDQLNSK